MTDWRPLPIRQVEIDRDNDEIEVEADNKVGPIAIPELPSVSNTRSRGLNAKIKDLFHDAVKALTGKAPTPAPKLRGKRTTGEIGHAFLTTARKLLRHVARRSVIQTLGLHEPQFWQWNNPDSMYAAVEESYPCDTNHLSPNL